MSETETMIARELERTIQYPIALNFINDLATEYMPLKISGILDKGGRAVVRKARLDVRNHRVAVEHKRKALKADALDYGRKVDSAAKLLTDELLKIENHLIAEETAVTDEIVRITREEEERKLALLEDRIKKLEAVKCSIMTYAGIGTMDSGQFAETLSTATERYEKKKAEEARQKHEAQGAEQQRKAEEKRLAVERKKLEEEKAELEAKKAKIEAEKQRVENERVEAVRKVAEEKQREEEAKAERERQKRLEAMRPDIEKLARIANTLDTIRVPEVASAHAQPKREQVIGILRRAAAQIREIIAE